MSGNSSRVSKVFSKIFLGKRALENGMVMPAAFLRLQLFKEWVTLSNR